MPMAGKGMLLTSMDIDAADDAEFNRWYDREHLEERIAIPGFLEARRYVAHDGKPKYLEDTPRFIGYARAVSARYGALAPLARLLDELE